VFAATGVAAVAVVGVIVGARVVSSQPTASADDPLALSAVEAPGATTAACATVIAALPEQLGGLARRTIQHADDPSLTGVAAWGEPAVVLRCGVPTPAELTCTAALQEVDGVAWLPLSTGGDTTYFLVDRSVRAALTVPAAVTTTGPWQETSKLIAATLPERDVCQGGVPRPADGE
jgi:Protein of unknown function (DUF3515)